MNRRDSERGQSETIGVLLLVGVGIVLVGVVAVLGLSFAEQTAQEPTVASLSSSVDDESVTVVHQAGDPLPVAETDIVLRTDGPPDRVPLSSAVAVTSDGDGRFDAGEAYRLSHAAEGQFRVQVVTGDAVVHDRSYTLAGQFVSRLTRFDRSPPTNWSGNRNVGGSVTVGADGRSVTLSGNRWQAVPFEYEVTEDTVVTVEFRSDDVGEIHGLGFETDTNQQSSRVVRLAGSQNWGVPVDSDRGGPYYTQGDGWVEYRIPIGEIYADRDRSYLTRSSTLLFVSDCDGCFATSQFRNVRVYEATD